MVRTMDWSSGCTTMVGDCDTTLPGVVTTLSTSITPRATKHAATMLLTTREMPRAARGTGTLVMAVEGDWNSRIAGRVGSSRSASSVLVALEEGRSESCMTRTLAVEVTILLRPEL